MWACLRFPRLALDAVCGEDASSSLQPLAVIDGPLQRRHVVLADDKAQLAGIRCGQPLTAAQALCPALSTKPRDPGAERQAIDSVAAWAYRFSADVSIAGSDAILLEIGASLTLFGGSRLLRSASTTRSPLPRLRPLRTCSPRKRTASQLRMRDRS